MLYLFRTIKSWEHTKYIFPYEVLRCIHCNVPIRNGFLVSVRFWNDFILLVGSIHPYNARCGKSHRPKSGPPLYLVLPNTTIKCLQRLRDFKENDLVMKLLWKPKRIYINGLETIGSKKDIEVLEKLCILFAVVHKADYIGK